MEGKVGIWRHFPPLLVFLVMSLGTAGFAQEADQRNPTQLNLRKSVYTREYQGKVVEGEERAVGRGDSLWRILVQEKGLPEKRFRSYLVVIRGLNPQVKNLDVLRNFGKRSRVGKDQRAGNQFNNGRDGILSSESGRVSLSDPPRPVGNL